MEHPKDRGGLTRRQLLRGAAGSALGLSAAGFLAGWGLLNREAWGRVLALVLGFVALIHVPLGTALGIYTLWVLLPAESEAEYAKYQAANAA